MSQAMPLAILWRPISPLYGEAKEKEEEEAIKTGMLTEQQSTAEEEELPDLLGRIALGDRDAFRLLYERQSARLYGIALRLTRDAGLAADALQEAFFQVWQHAGAFDAARGRAETWLISLLRYRALDLLRRQRREDPVAEPQSPDLRDESPDAIETLSRQHEADALRRCLETLPADRRALLTAAFLDGFSHQELAQRLKTPLGTIKSWIRRSLAALKECLEP